MRFGADMTISITRGSSRQWTDGMGLTIGAAKTRLTRSIGLWYDKRRGDLIDLTASEWTDDIALHAAAFILVADDATALEVLPERPSVAEDITARRFLSKLFALAPGDLSGLHETHLWPVAKCKVRDATAV